MTNEYMPTIFQINPSFTNASHPCLKGTYMLIKFSIFLKDLERILLAGSYRKRSKDLVGKNP